MIQSRIVARAIYDGGTSRPTDDEPTPYEYKKGEIGVVAWHDHRHHPGYYRVFIVWDKDPVRAQRPTVLNALEFTGIQIDDVAARVLFQPLNTQ